MNTEQLNEARIYAQGGLPQGYQWDDTAKRMAIIAKMLRALEIISTAGSGDRGNGSHQRKAALIQAMKNIALEAIANAKGETI